jgi:hypothetical protein
MIAAKKYVEAIQNLSVDPPTTVCSITITPPSSGYILLTVNATVTILGDGTRCWFGVGTEEGSYNLHRTTVGVLDGVEKKRRDFSATSIDLYGPVVEDKTYTFYATAHKSSTYNTGNIDLSYVQFIAIFIEAT